VCGEKALGTVVLFLGFLSLYPQSLTHRCDLQSGIVVRFGMGVGGGLEIPVVGLDHGTVVLVDATLTKNLGEGGA
jgi:hypothetical protein